MKPLLMGPVWLLIFLFFHFMITFLWSLLRLFRLLTESRRPLHRRVAYMAIEVGVQFLYYLCVNVTGSSSFRIGPLAFYYIHYDPKLSD